MVVNGIGLSAYGQWLAKDVLCEDAVIQMHGRDIGTYQQYGSSQNILIYEGDRHEAYKRIDECVKVYAGRIRKMAGIDSSYRIFFPVLCELCILEHMISRLQLHHGDTDMRLVLKEGSYHLSPYPLSIDQDMSGSSYGIRIRSDVMKKELMGTGLFEFLCNEEVKRVRGL